MKRVAMLLLSLLLLTGCAPKEPTTDAAAIDLGGAVAESQPEEFSNSLTPLSDQLDPEGLEAYLTTAYGLDRTDWVDAVAAYAQGLQAYELAVIRLSADADAGAAEELLLDYLESRGRIRREARAEKRVYFPADACREA